jgi:hypothetical protein
MRIDICAACGGAIGPQGEGEEVSAVKHARADR